MALTNTLPRLREVARRYAHAVRLSVRRCVIPGLITAFVSLPATPAFAQGAEIIQPERTPYLEAVVTAALCGAALFAVCRSSRRN